MNRKQYPLHPGQTHVYPMYTQAPTEDYEALKREVQQLRELTAGSRTTIDDIAEIKTLTSEVNALREMNAKAQEEIAELREATRWRKFTDEKPEHHQWIEACYCEDRIRERLPRIDIRRWDEGMKYDVFEQELYIGWRPLPKTPEET